MESRAHTGGHAGGHTALAARLVGAGLLVATASIHLDLYLTGYRTIPTIGWLFLLQVVTGFVLGGAVLAAGNWLVAGMGAGFALATLGGYLLSIWVGLFGFKEVRTTAGVVAGIVEVLSLAVLGWLSVATSPLPGRASARRGSASARPGPSPALGPVGAAVAALAVLIGTVVAASGASASARSSGPALLGVRTVGGTKVLTDARGLTLYWFALDSATVSRCYGTCAAYWPPVLGRPKAGPGVAGVLGTITRNDGKIQATYDHHPLYTYVGDSSPGSANGNGLDLNGGLWHEVVVGASG